MKLIHRAIKALGRELLRTPRPLSYRYHAKLRPPLGALIAYLHLTRPDFFFVQVGANDGKRADPIHPFVERFRLRGMLLEPQPELFAALQYTYRDRPDLILVNAAIAAEDGSVMLHRVRPDVAKVSWLNGIATLDSAMLAKHAAAVPNWDAVVEKIAVPSVCPNSLLRQHNVTRIDLLQVDTEGFDYEVLKLFDVENTRPALIHFEHKHLPLAKYESCLDMLIRAGYRIAYSYEDTTACHATVLPDE